MLNEDLTTPLLARPPVVVHPSATLESLRDAVHGARAALAALLGAAGVDATKTRETARALNVNRGLVWRVSRAVGAEDDVTAATNLPGQVGLERLLEACRERGVGEDVLGAARAAVRRFHDVAASGFGDRRTLEILLANAGEESTSIDLESARKAMFDGGCAVWGVRADVRLRIMFLAPNRDDPAMLDEADVAGYVGFRRLRRVPWPMSYKAVYTDTGADDAPAEEPIDQAPGGTSSLPLLREFCEPRDLTVNLVKTGRGGVRHELPVTPGLGSEPMTCLFGAVFRKIYTARSTPRCRIAGSLVVMDTPVERVILDCFVHRSLVGPGAPGGTNGAGTNGGTNAGGGMGSPRVTLVDRLTRPHGFSEEELDQEALPFEIQPRRLGPGASGAVTPHVPWYPRLVERVCARLGYGADEFIAYRAEMVYPPIPTALVVRFRLPE